MLNDLRNEALERLTEKETRRLVRRAQRGQPHAAETLLRANVGAIVKTASQFTYRLSPTFTSDDLGQEAVTAFYRAILRFDLRRPNRFITYAVSVMKREIPRAADNIAAGLRLPVHRQTRLRKLNAMQAEHLTRTGQSLPLGEFASPAGLTAEQVARLIDSPRVVVSLDQEVGDKGKDTVGELLPAFAEPERPENTARVLSHLAECLSPEQYRVVVRHLGLTGLPPQLHGQIAHALGLLEMQVSVLWNESLEILRQPEHAEFFSALVEGE